MVDTLQSIASTLGARIHRAVAIDDTAMRLLAHTPHHGPVDEPRMTSILQRQPDQVSTAYALSQGIALAEGPVRIPAKNDIGMMARVCAPIRCQGLLLGYVWIIDADSDLDQDGLVAVTEAATAAGVVMFRDQMLGDGERRRERGLVRDLLDGDPATRERSATALSDDESLAAPPRVHCVLVTLVVANVEDETIRVTLASALERVQRTLPPRSSLSLARQSDGVLLVASQDAGGRVEAAEAAVRLRAELISQLPHAVVRCGVGQAAALAEAATSFTQARQCLVVAGVVPGFGDVTTWPQLGVYGILSRLRADQITLADLHPGLGRLMELDGGPLLETLEAYLDRAGDARATADALLVHRTSLYYRLTRLEQLGEFSLADGADRLGLHLGIKLARLAGLYPA